MVKLKLILILYPAVLVYKRTPAGKESLILNEIKWNERLNIGVESIDKAHQRLFSIVNKLILLNEDTAKQQHACEEGIKYFKNYTLKHFAEEEAYMRYIDYANYSIHKSLHDDMRDNTLPALERELNAQNYSVESVQHFLGIFIGWLNGHIMVEDRAITGKVSNKWVHQPSDDEENSLKNAVIQAFHGLFRTDAQIVSKHYSGEDFAAGNKLCYRLTYRSKEKEVVPVYIIYEERMVLHVLSELFGKPVKKADKTVVYALKILSQQLMDSIGKHFTFAEECILEKNDLLTFDQLLNFFYKKYPPYSLLFSTGGKGYFALCINIDKKTA